MPTTRFRRQFSSGSRPPPDPYDQFLDSEGFYRKHTARDASCLFRTVAELMFDTQESHQSVRRDCVNFMIAHRDQYELEIRMDFDEYVRDMLKPRTYGTFLELKALGHLYKRNVLLYQPYDLGAWLVCDNQYTGDCLRIFFAPEKHFDPIFTKNFIVKAAFCQCKCENSVEESGISHDNAINPIFSSFFSLDRAAICYETLYKSVFNLPDVEYAVEMMLHGIQEDDLKRFEYDNDLYANHIVLKDGRKFELDRPGEFCDDFGLTSNALTPKRFVYISESTLCILDDSTLCHFHNPMFETMSGEAEGFGKYASIQRLNSSLPERYISCVRQLLDQGKDRVCSLLRSHSFTRSLFFSFL